jgi:hypothetical protein
VIGKIKKKKKKEEEFEREEGFSGQQNHRNTTHTRTASPAVDTHRVNLSKLWLFGCIV